MLSLLMLLAAAPEPLAPTLAPPGAQSELRPASGEAILELIRGRAVLVTTDISERSGSVELKVGQESSVTEQGLIELRPQSRAHLRWKGRLSAFIDGPAFFEWQPSQEEGVEPGSLALRVQRLENLEIEVREGRHTLHMPNDWRARVESTAFRLSQRAGGGFDLRVHAGQSVAMEWRGDPGRARPPVWAHPGHAVQFHLPALSPPDDRRSEHAWTDPSWPWAVETAPPGSDRERKRLVAILDRHAAGPRAWPAPALEGWGGEADVRLPEVDRVSMTEPPQAQDVDPSSLPPWLRSRAGSQSARSAPSSRPKPRPTPQAAPSRPAAPASPALEPSSTARGWLVPDDPPVTLESYRVDDWRGRPREDLRWAGSLIVAAGPGVEVRERSRGRLKVTASAEAAECWVFTPRSDVRIQPGSVVTFQPDGSIQTRIGEVEVFPPQDSRPLERAP